MKTISLTRPAAYLRKHVFELQLFLLTIFVLVAAVWVVVEVGRQKATLAAEEIRVSQAATTVSAWIVAFQPAASEESVAWRQTSMEARQLGSSHDERLAITAEIARQAERPGLTAVRVAFATPDSISAASMPRRAGPYFFSPAAYRVSINFLGDLGTAKGLLGNLPAAALVTGMKFKREGSAIRGSIMLNIYEPAGGR